MTTQGALWIFAGGAAGVAGIAAYGDRRRVRRRDMDRVGWVPWPLIMTLAMLLAAICAAIALKG